MLYHCVVTNISHVLNVFTLTVIGLPFSEKDNIRERYVARRNGVAYN